MKPGVLHFPVIILTFSLFFGTASSAAVTGLQTAEPGRLAVDFTNDESRSISIRLGSADGITADMNFAVLDSSNAQIAEFYPHEILLDRFWSGPLAIKDFKKVGSDAAVVRIDLKAADAVVLREQFSQRLAALKEERDKRRVEDLTIEKEELEELVNDVKIDLVGLSNEMESLRGKLRREKEVVKRQMDNLQDQIDDLRDERSELKEDREDLLDRREDLLLRITPPQDRIRDLNEDIADVDRDIGTINQDIQELRDDIRDLREDGNDIQADINNLREEQRELDIEWRKWKMELIAVEKEIARLKEKKEP